MIKSLLIFSLLFTACTYQKTTLKINPKGYPTDTLICDLKCWDNIYYNSEVYITVHSTFD